MAETYILDANVFIEAARRYYAFDLVPTFWQALLGQASEGRVQSIDRVRQELLRGNDELADWVTGEFSGSFVSTDSDDVIESYREVMTWAQQQAQYTEAAKAEFARVADGWLVAYARARNCTLVTREHFTPDAKARIKIPNACRALGVSTIDTFAMMRALRVRL